FDRQVPFGMSREAIRQFVQGSGCAVLEPVAAGIEEDIVRDIVDGNTIFLPDDGGRRRRRDDDGRRKGTAMVGGRSGAVRALVDLIVDAVSVPVRDRAAVVSGKASDRRAGIVLVVDPVVIGVRHRAALVLGGSRFERACILVVRDTVLIGVFFLQMRRGPSGIEPNAERGAEYSMTESPGIRRVVETGYAATEIGAYHDVSQLET